MHDVIVVGGGFAGVAAAREAVRAGRSALLLEARDRLGGRTWTAAWNGHDIEYGGGWVHWHQPHTWSEVLRHGLGVEIGAPADQTWWHVGEERRRGTNAERDAIAKRGWDAFLEGVDDYLPLPYDPTARMDAFRRIEGQTIQQRMDELDLDDEERDVLAAELESVAHGYLDDAGAASIARWHALSGYSLELTQYTGGRITIPSGTRSLVEAIADEAPFERRLSTPVAAVRQAGGRVEVETRAGELLPAGAVVVAVPLNALPGIAFEPGLSELKQAGIALGQASRGIKIFIRARGEAIAQNSIRRAHPFGYLDTEILEDGGTQVLIGFGRDAAVCDATDLAWVQRELDAILPGYEAIDASAHDWLADEFARGTWAIHRPGWYATYHRELQRPEGRVVLGGSDLADGWAGFMDGAIESGIRVGRTAAALAAG